MKKTNKGFSMVELIIVIAIMAILAGALAPALIKYINKSRLSSDIQTGQTIATGVQNAIATENGYDAAVSTTYDQQWVSLTTVYNNTDALAQEVKSTAGTNQPAPKAKKDMLGNSLVASGTTAEYYIYVDAQNNEVKVALDSNGNHLVYPTPTECLTSDDSSVTCGSNSNNNNNNNNNAGN